MKKLNLLNSLFRTSNQSRQSQQNKTHYHYSQNKIKNHYVIHNLFLSKYNDAVQDNNVTINPDNIISGFDLSIQKGITTEAIETWARSAQIEANLSIWFSVNNGAFLIQIKNNLLINNYHNISH